MATRECCDRCTSVRKLRWVYVTVYVPGPDGKAKIITQGKRLLCPRCEKRLVGKMENGFAPIKQLEPAEPPTEPQAPEAGDDSKPAEPQPAAGRTAG